MKELLSVVKTVPELNHQRYDALGVRVNKALKSYDDKVSSSTSS